MHREASYKHHWQQHTREGSHTSRGGHPTIPLAAMCAPVLPSAAHTQDSFAHPPGTVFLLAAMCTISKMRSTRDPSMFCVRSREVAGAFPPYAIKCALVTCVHAVAPGMSGLAQPLRLVAQRALTWPSKGPKACSLTLGGASDASYSFPSGWLHHILLAHHSCTSKLGELQGRCVANSRHKRARTAHTHTQMVLALETGPSA